MDLTPVTGGVIGAAIGAIGMVVAGFFKYRTDTSHNKSNDLLNWTREANEQLRIQREFYEAKLVQQDKKLQSQEARCHTEINTLRLQIQKQQHLIAQIMKDVAITGRIINMPPEDKQ